MNADRMMTIVLIEDDPSACKAFIDCVNSRSDVEFVGITGHSGKGLQFVKDKLPEAVILDMELNWGEGSGLDFLEALQKTQLSIRPIVVVTTRNRSELMQDHLHEYCIEWVFHKKQKGYCPEMVINRLVKLRPYLYKTQRGDLPPGLQTIETPEEQRNRIYRRIDAELNAMGFSVKLKGRTLAREGIYLLVTRDKRQWETVFYDLAVMNQTHYNNIVRPIDTAINDAWKNADIEALDKLYTAPIRKDVGIPTPTEFVYHLADKIRFTM